MEIKALLLGTPRLYRNHEVVYFPYSKVAGLVYYMLCRDVAMRDTLSSLLWGHKNHEIARKNLRNALYEAKRVLGDDFFLFPSKTCVMVNPAVHVSVDVKLFTKHPLHELDCYEGEFLQGFYIKGAFEYEDWSSSERYRLQSIYMHALENKVERLFAKGDDWGTIDYGRRLLTHNPYHEECYTYLLKSYHHIDRHDELERIYREAKQAFEEGLGVSLPRSIKKTMQDITHES